ncbi:MAG: class I SAM-dependent methyltransferase [Ignavibacteriales bacterium]|nr:class I SAM-dependent methyltransferase [Ignavibacteriales bacterium]
MDVGCGDGTISVELDNNFTVIASDRSVNALKHFKIKRVCNSADSLSIKSNSVDLVFSSEMIEHLPDNIFLSAIEEFKRVSKNIFFDFSK